MQEMQVRSLGQEDSLEKEMEARWQVDSLPLGKKTSVESLLVGIYYDA